MEHNSNCVVIRDVAPLPAVTGTALLFWGWPTGLIILGIILVALVVFGILYFVLRKKPQEENTAGSVLNDAFLRTSTQEIPSSEPSESTDAVPEMAPEQYSAPILDANSVILDPVEPIAPVDAEVQPVPEAEPVSEAAPIVEVAAMDEIDPIPEEIRNVENQTSSIVLEDSIENPDSTEISEPPPA